jgi:hypothetical protein
VSDLRQQADAYFAGMRAREVEPMVAKFAPHGTLVLPDGREITGHAALRTLYIGLFGADAPSPTPQNFVVGPDQVAVEIEVKLDDGGSRHTANFFRFDAAGNIVRLSIYRRA